MKKALLLLLVAAVLVVWHMTSGSDLNPALLRQGQSAARAQRGVVVAPRYITLIDYRKSILQTRLWVYDQKAKKVVLSSRVSHAFKSGVVYASSFSNVNSSEKSCTGSFVTGTTYSGKFGYSLRLKGLDPSNYNTLSRAIIVHNAPYYLPWTAGCLATNVNKELIDLTKGGSFIFISR
jgi:L,D-transpeptidase catalytic domain